MDPKISDFFKPIQVTSYIGSKNYEKVEGYLSALKAMSKLCDLSYYIIDYYKKSFFYVSPNPLFLSGYSQREVVNIGYDFYGRCVPQDDLKLLFELNEAGFQFFYELPVDRREFATISYDFRLNHKSNGSSVMVNHKLAPLLLTDDGNIWMAICLVTLSSNKAPGDVHIMMQDERVRYNFNRGRRCFRKTQQKELTKREYDILKCIAMGDKIEEIENKLKISGSTVKNHKTKIFKKLNAKNSAEAVFFASKRNII